MGEREGASKHVIAQICGTAISSPPCWNFLSTRTRTCASTTCACGNAIKRIHDESGRSNGSRFIEMSVFFNPSALAGSNVSPCDRRRLPQFSSSLLCIYLTAHHPQGCVRVVSRFWPLKRLKSGPRREVKIQGKYHTIKVRRIMVILSDPQRLFQGSA